jgi:hypothetical protein
MESRIAELERLVLAANERVRLLATAVVNVVTYLSERDAGYRAACGLPPAATPPRSGLISDQVKDVPTIGQPLVKTPITITRQDVNMLVPAVHELQQLYQEIARHFQQENLEGRVLALEQEADEFDHQQVLDRLAQLGSRIEAIDQVLCRYTVDPLEVAGIFDRLRRIEGFMEQQTLLNSHFANQQKKISRGIAAVVELMTAAINRIVSADRCGWKGPNGR